MPSPAFSFDPTSDPTHAPTQRPTSTPQGGTSSAGQGQGSSIPQHFDSTANTGTTTVVKSANPVKPGGGSFGGPPAEVTKLDGFSVSRKAVTGDRGSQLGL